MADTVSPLLGEPFEQALSWAVALHREQTRKGTRTPYIAHLLGVASIALENGANEAQAIAALLHDAVEDQDVTVEEVERRFGARVARMVADCTDSFGGEKAEWKPRKQAYLASLDHKDASSLLVSVSDKTHNARAIVDDLAVHGDALWSRFTGGKDGSLWYYGALADAFARLMPGPASVRLRAAVKQMHALASAPVS